MTVLRETPISLARSRVDGSRVPATSEPPRMESLKAVAICLCSGIPLVRSIDEMSGKQTTALRFWYPIWTQLSIFTPMY